MISIVIIHYFHKHVSKVLKLHEPQIAQSGMLNMPLNQDDYRLCDVENKLAAKKFADYFVIYHSSHFNECERIMNAQFRMSHSDFVVLFSHAKMKAPSLVNTHLFINTQENHKIPQGGIIVDVLGLVWHDYHYGLRHLRHNIFSHYILGEARDKRGLHHLLNNSLHKVDQIHRPSLPICSQYAMLCSNNLDNGQWTTWE